MKAGQKIQVLLKIITSVRRIVATQLTIKNPLHQKGLALVILIVAIALAFISYIISELSVSEIHHQQDVKTLAALKKAKQALINYSVTYTDLAGVGEYGFMPCPDYTNTGLAEGLEDDGNCGARGIPKIGYFPWKTLDIPPLYDESGTCLFYAVTGDYKNNETSKKALMLNADTNGAFQIVDDAGLVIEGAFPEDRVVAIVFAAGTIVGAQNRTFDAASICGKDYGINPLYELPGYLEGDGVIDNGTLSGAADTIDQFIKASINSKNAVPPYNDKFATITRGEIWSAIQKRSDFNDKMTNLTEALALCLIKYAEEGGNNRLPWPAPFELADYRLDGNYIDLPGAYAGRVPFKVDSSNSATGVGVSDLFEASGCDNLSLDSGTIIADLSNVNDEYRQLWKNWKDHFYYALSVAFEPSGVAVVGCPPSTNCIQVDGTDVAGVVFFSGKRQPGQTRNLPPPLIQADDKKTITNYIDGLINPGVLAAAVGNNSDGYELNPGNDEMFCISADPLLLTAGSCP